MNESERTMGSCWRLDRPNKAPTAAGQKGVTALPDLPPRRRLLVSLHALPAANVEVSEAR